MKIVKELTNISEEDLIDGKFENDEITKIGRWCFNDMNTLKEVSCKNVDEVDCHCFGRNPLLSKINLPNAKYITYECTFFRNCSLTEVNLPLSSLEPKVDHYRDRKGFFGYNRYFA